MDFQVKVRGFRIELGEIENQLINHPQIKEAVVTVKRGETGDQFLCAYIVPYSPGSSQVPQLKEYLHEKLPDYMVPAYFVQLVEMPLTPTGKVDRKVLPQPEILSSGKYIAPRDALEEALVGIWSQVLEISKEKIGINANFFELGGHSLKSIGLVTRIHKELGIQLQLSTFLKLPTIQQLSAHIRSSTGKGYVPIEPAEEKEYYELTPSQKRFFVFHQLSPGDTSYNMPEVMLVEGVLIKERFKIAVQRLINRQESLRTSFHLLKGEPVQFIHKNVDFEIEYHDSGREGDREIGFVQPFDLGQPPLLRLEFIKIGTGKHFLMFDMHHIISDGVSIGIFIKEFLELYVTTEITPLKIQYRDYVEWRKKQEKEAVKTRTPKIEEVLNLPLDYPRPAVPNYEGKEVKFQLPPRQVEKLTALSIQENVTLYTTLLAAFEIFLAKVSNQEQIVLGSPIAGRLHHDLQGIIGLFINTLVLQGFPSGQKRYSEFLQEVKENALNAFESQDYQYLELVEEVVLAGETGRNPLYDVMFVLQNMEIPEIEIPGLKVTRDVGERLTSKFDITLYYEENDNPLFRLEYSTALFKPDTIKRFIGYFKKVISQVLENPHKKISEIEILSPEEKQQILYDFNHTAVSYSKEKTIYQVIQEQVERTPDQIALVGVHEIHETNEKNHHMSHTSYMSHLSYKELNKTANQLAGLLRVRGVRSGTIVAVMMERSVEVVVGIQGILKAGGVYLPVDPHYPPSRIVSMMGSSGASFVLTHSETYEKKSLSSLAPAKPLEFLLLDKLAGELANQSTENLHPLSGPGDLIYIIFTSGSTGKPKGAAVYHRGFMNLMHWFVTEFELRMEDSNLLLTSLSFDLTQKNLYASLLKGGTIYIPSLNYFEPAALLQQIHRNRVTWINCTPGMFYKLVEHEESAREKQLASLQYVFLGGESIFLTTLIDWLEADYHDALIVNTYGPTECTDICASYRITEPRRFLQETIPVGSPVYNVQLFVPDNNLQPLPVGVPGELLIAGEGVGFGYVNDKELTSRKFIRHSFGTGEAEKLFYRSGDLVKWLPDGNIEFLGRIDHQVKIRGFRIELGEIENLLLNHPDIKEAVVMARDSSEGDKYLCVYIVPHSTATPREPDLRSYLSNELPEYMVPAYFVMLDKMPLNPNGKVDRKSLPEPDITAPKGYVPPGNETEETLAEIWSEVLGLDKNRISIHDSFFQLGGHSLKAAGLMGRIFKIFSVEIPIGELFKNPTIKAVANYIHSAGTGLHRYCPVELIEEKEYYSLSSSQKRLFVINQMDPFSMNYNLPGVMILAGQLDREQFTEAFKQLIHRHESLRTSFLMPEDEPVQRIHKQIEFEIEYQDSGRQGGRETGNLLKSSGKQADREIGNEEDTSNTDSQPSILSQRTPLSLSPSLPELFKKFIRPFDLSQAPLLRVGLLPAPCPLLPASSILMIDMHHIISDGLSSQVLIRDFSALYRGSQLPPLTLQYKDYAGWQQREKELEKVREQGEYWKKEFSGDIPVLELPADYARPTIQDFAGAGIHFEISKELTDALRFLATERGATLYMLLLALYTVFLAKITGQEDIVVGTPVAGRRHAELEDIIGMFVNTLALRNYPSGEKTFNHFLAEIKENTLKAFENQEYQYEDLVEQVTVSRDLSRNPLFDTMLVLQNTGAEKIRIPGLQLSPYAYETKTSKFDMTLIGEETGEKLTFTWEYSTRLFKKETIERYIAYLKKILQEVLEDKSGEITIAGIEILPPGEKRKILYEFNDTSVEFLKGKLIHELFQDQVARSPDHTALAGPGLGENGRWNLFVTYNELNQKAQQLCSLLIHQGLKPGKIVAMVVERSVEMVAAMLAILKAGSGYLPIDPDYPQARIQYILADSAVSMVLSGEKHRNKLNCGAKIIHLVEENPCKSPGGDSHQFPVGKIHRQDNLLYVIYTSGSTGKPKGVLVNHKGFENLVYYHREIFGNGLGDHISQTAGPGFDAMAFEVWPCLLSGGTLYIARDDIRTDAVKMKEWLIKNAIAISFQSTVIAEQLLQEEWRQQGSALKILRTAGDRLTRYSEPYHPFRFFNLYGPTEDTVWTTYTEVKTCREKGKYPPIGKPIANHRVYIVGPGFSFQPIGIGGELVVGGTGLALGYLNQPQLTAEKFLEQVTGAGDRCRWKTQFSFNKSFCGGPGGSFFKKRPLAFGDRIYRTGDLARWLPGGSIEFLGRIDLQVKIRGFRIELGEIENCLSAHPAIKEVIVTARENNKKEKYLCAYIVPGNKFTMPGLREFLSKVVPGYMIPSYFVEIGRIPLTPNGKIDRKALPEPGLQIQGKEYTPPQDPVEKKLAEIWSELLGIETGKIDIHDDFFALGGHSLKATAMMSKIHKEFEIKIGLAEMFKNSSIRSLARLIKKSDKIRFAQIEPAEKREYYALSSAQKRLYFLQLLEETSTGYNIPLAMKLEGKIERERLENTFRKLIRRHENFRTSFFMLENEPLQRIHEEVDFEIEYYVKKFIRPFDLSRAPLLRVGLLPASSILLVDMHHIITDGASNAILKDEFNMLYSGGVEDLPQLRLQYKDYARWQNSETRQVLIKEQETYWLNMFAGEIPVLNLPVDYPRPIMQSFAGAAVEFLLTAEESQTIKMLAKKTGSTLYMSILSVFIILLARLSGQEDIVVGTPVAARGHADLEKIIGMFVNTLALRNNFVKEKKYEEFLQELKERTLKAFENQEYPFETLVDKTNVVRDTSRNPLFDVMFNLLNTGEYNSGDDFQKSPQGEIYQYQHRQGTSKFDLTLTAVDLGERLLFTFEYCTKLFESATIDRFISYFKKLLALLAENSHQPLSKLEIITAAEKQQILYEFNETKADYPQDKTIHQLFAEQVKRTPHRVALVGVHEIHETNEKNHHMSHTSYMSHLSYKELNRTSNRLAYLLKEKNVKPGTIVAIMVERSIEMVIGIFGILKAGGAYLPIVPDYPQERIRYMLTDSKAKILLTKEEIRDLFSPEAFNICPQGTSSQLHLSPAPVTSLAYIIYTSGSTGKPKGVMVEHKSVVNVLSLLHKKYPLLEQDTYLFKTSYIFDVSVAEIFGWFLGGGGLVILEKGGEKDPKKIIDTIETREITHINFVPSMFNVFLESLNHQNINRLASLKYIFLAGEALLPDLVNKFRQFNTKIPLENLYGPTEGTVYSSKYSLSAWKPNRGIPIGKPLPNMKLYILDKDNHLQPIGIPGELCISGKGLARGYLNNPELTAERFLATEATEVIFNQKLMRGVQRLYRTGDLARWLADGNIEFLGRIDHQVKLRGFRVELGEIECQLLKYKGITEAAVVVKRDSGNDKYLAAYVVSSREFSAAEIREYLSKELPDYMIPTYFTRLDQMPLTPTGKLDRKALPGPVLTGKAIKKDYNPPRDAIEKKLVEIWSDLLYRDDPKPSIGIDDNFFHYGGHSLKAITLISRIHKEFHINIPIAEIFKKPTIKGLSAYIRKGEKEIYISIEPGEEKEYYPLSSAQKRLYILHQVDKQSTGYNMPYGVILEGKVNGDELENAFTGLIERHESLRTSFAVIEGEPIQRIHKEVEFEIDYYGSGRQGNREIGNKRIPVSLSPSLPEHIKDFIRPFDLSEAPLLRVGLIKTGEQKHFLIVDMHHIISDGVSIEILINDFSAAYAKENLPGISVRYRDYAEWQNREKGNENLLQQREFWKKEFAAEIPVLELPTDYARPAVQDFAGSRLNFEINSETTGALKTLALETGTTLYMVTLALYTIFLSKLSNQEDIVVGAPTAGRRHADLEKIIGMFVNTLALRSFPSGEKEFTHFLEEVKAKTLKAFENQEYQYEDLVEEVVVDRHLDRNPLFDTMFVLQNTGFREKKIPGLQVIPYEYQSETSKFDLTLIGVEVEEKLLFTFEYSTCLFKDHTIKRFIGYFQKMLSLVPGNPAVKISGIEMISDEEKQQILYDFSAGGTGYPADKTLHQLFEEQVKRTPDHTALLEAHQAQEKIHHTSYTTHLSYKELNKASNRLARILRQRGVQPDTIIAMMVNRSLEMIIGIYGILKAGGAYLPIEPSYPEERIRYMLADSNARFLVSMVSMVSKVSEVGRSCIVINIDDIGKDIESSPTHPHTHSPTQLSYIIYTSGTTGKSKGTLITHSNVIRVIKKPNYIRLKKEDRILQLSNYAFDGSVFDIYGALSNGAALVLLEKETLLAVDRLAQLIKREQVTVFFITTALFNVLVELEIQCLQDVRKVLCGGERLSVNHSRKTLEYLGKGRIINGYGPTETTVFASYYFIDEIDSCAGTIPIGRPISETTIYILNRNLQVVPLGVAGEIYIGGAGVARGYLNRPELTAEKFLSGFYRSYRSYMSYISKKIYKTGDLARWLPDGNIEFIDRIDHQIKLRGFRIELGEIENQLLTHEKVKEATVIVREDSSRDKYLCAYIVVKKEEAPSLELMELREYLAQRLPEYMLPAYIVQLEGIPLTPNGKIDRKALPDPGFAAGSYDYIPPGDEIEKKLAEIWWELLGIDTKKISIHDNFFALGGHSLKATIMMSKIHKELETKIDLAEMFKNPTISKLARLIKKSAKNRHAQIEPAEKREYYALSSAQKRLYFLQLMEETGTGYNISLVMELEGKIRIEKLNNIFQKLIRRHESFRTSFFMLENEPLQKIHEEVDFEIEYYSSGREGERERGNLLKNSGRQGNRGIGELIKKFLRPFDLTRVPLMRVGLIAIKESRFILMLDFHHIILDGTSMGVLVNEFISLYEGKELAEARIQYKDYTAWESRQKQDKAFENQETFWLKTFEGEIPVLDLPADYLRPAVQSFAGSTLSFQVDPSQTRSLKTLASRQSTTLYMILLSIYNVFLSRLSGQEVIVVGTPTAGRRHADLEKVMGMFVNTLALKNYPSGEKTFIEFLGGVKETTLAAFANQDYQYEELVEKVMVSRDASRNPLFDVMLILQNLEIPTVEKFDWTLKPCEIKRDTAKFDFTLEYKENNNNISCIVEYSTRLFKEETIHRFIRYLKQITAAVLDQPQNKISQIDMLPEEEKKLLVSDFNDTTKEFPTGKTIYRLFEEQVDEHPDHTVLKGPILQIKKYKSQITNHKQAGSTGRLGDDVFITYREFDNRANQLANYLRKEKGINIGDRIIVLMERSVELIIALMGVIKGGAAYIPLDPQQPAERLRVVFNDALISVVISQQKFIQKLMPLQEKCQSFHSLLCLDDPEKDNEIEKYPALRPGIAGAANPAYVMYTSGSSGTPKGVLVEHRTIVNTLLWRKNFYEYAPGNVSLQIPPYFFDSSVTDIFTPLLGGARLVLVTEDERVDLEVLKRVITINNVSHFIVVPAFYNVLVEEIADYLKNVKMITAAGENFPDELIRKHFEKLPHVRVFNEYGPTENSVNTSAYELKPESPKALIGKPINNAAVYILDRYLSPCPIGVGGEMCLAGSSLARGYLNSPELTFEKFCLRRPGALFEKTAPGPRKNFLLFPHSPIYRTGDLGRWLADGNLEFLGRVDTQVKIRGIRVETGEIENHLLKRNDIKDAVVLAREGTGAEKYFCAYVVLSSGELDSEANLKAYLSQRLPEYMVPSYFISIDAIPLTPAGKIHREALPEPAVSKEVRIVPGNRIEKELAEIWTNVLNVPVDAIGIDSDFFQLGGHSLKATIAASRIHKGFDIKVPLAEMFTHSTIRAMAQYIGHAQQERFTGIEPAEKKEYYLLSSAQKRLYLLQCMDLHNTGYNMPMVITFQGTPHKEKLETVFRKLIQRHQSLRTSFEMVAGEPVQKIHEEVDFALESYEAHEIDTEEIKTRLMQPFDLTRPPLLRGCLINPQSSPAGSFLLFLDMHHIITDGASHAILKDEFNVLYTGKAEALPLLRLQYKDYSQWQHSEAQRTLTKEQESYWLNMFSDEIPMLTLPTDFPRPLIQSFAGCTVEFLLTGKESKTLKTLAKEKGATLYMSILSVFTILLSKLSGQEHIIVGTPILGRRHTDLEGIIGMFVNTLALRNQPSGEKRFKDFLCEVKERTLEAYENQEYQFEDLVDKINIVRDTGRNPLFDVMFNLLNIEEYSEDFPGIYQRDSHQYIHRKGVSKFDLTLTAVDVGEELLCCFEYCTKLFEPATIERFIAYFKKILNLLSKNSDQKLSQLEIITEAEKQQILYEFNDTKAEYPQGITIHQLFEKQVEKTPDHTALLGVQVSHKSYMSHLSYKELNKTSNQLAHLLKEKDVKSGTIVAIMAERSMEMVIGILGILKAGGAYLPIVPGYPEERIQYMLTDSKAKILLKKSEIRISKSETNPNDRNSNGQNERAKITVLDFEHLNFEFVSNFELRASNLYPSNLSYIIYTSGTTGKPKGVAVEHSSVVNLLYALQQRYPFNENDTYLLKTSYIFDVSVSELFGWYMGAGRLSVLEQGMEKDPETIINTIETTQVTHINFVPSMFSAFQESLNPKTIKRLSSLKYIFLAGEALPPAEVRGFRELNTTIQLENIYGPTESTVYASWYSLEQWKNEDSIPIGKPLPNVQLYILDRWGYMLPPGMVGELCISGVSLARGYLNKPELTNEKFYLRRPEGRFLKKLPLWTPRKNFLLFTHTPIYKTGDLARWLSDGNIEFLGRMDFQVKIRGFRIELEEIESRLKTHPDIKDAIVIDRKDNERHYLCAYVVLESTPGKDTPALPEFKEYLEGNLPAYMVPACFVSIEQVPLNPSGKVDRSQLPQPLEADFHSSSTYEPPINDLQHIIAEIWQEVLDRGKIGIQDNFFDLGGNSLDFIKISSKLTEKLHQEITAVTLFTYPTIRSLELYLTRQQEEGEDDTGLFLMDEGKDFMFQTLKKLDEVD